MNDLPLDQQILAAAMQYADSREDTGPVGEHMRNLRLLTDEVKDLTKELEEYRNGRR